MLQHILLQNGTYLIPRDDGHILVGSTLEDVGFDKATTEAARVALHAQALGMLPQLARQILSSTGRAAPGCTRQYPDHRPAPPA